MPGGPGLCGAFGRCPAAWSDACGAVETSRLLTRMDTQGLLLRLVSRSHDYCLCSPMRAVISTAGMLN